MDSEANAGMGGGKHDKKKRLLIGVALFVLVAVVATAAGVGLRWQQQKNTTTNDARPGEVKLAKEVTDAQKQAQEGDYDKAHETINKALGDSSISTQEKHDLYIQQGITYENQKSYDAALESYYKAESVKESLQSAQFIANLEAKKGNKERAIIYYKKAITLLPDDQPQVRDNLKQYFENTIIYLEGGQPKYE